MSLTGKTVLVTGGAGSLGFYLVKALLRTNAKAIRIFDSNEYGLFLLNREVRNPRLRSLLGDVRDRERVDMAIRGVDAVIHAAALKNIEVTEYNIPEAVRTNVDGTVNLVELAMHHAVEKFLFVSSDKAVNSPTLYGASKLVGEKVVLWANRVAAPDHIFSCVRMGNFLEARGNVLELWKQQADKNEALTLTHPQMKRYYLPTPDAAAFVLSSLERMQGGEVFVPKMEEFSMLKMLRALYPKKAVKMIGLRPGERMREELLTREERQHAKEFDDQWIVRER